MTNTIGIIGCGWLGLSLAKNLIADGYTVNGTTTSKEKLPILVKAGIRAFEISITESEVKGDIATFLRSCEVLVINVPPGLRGAGTKASYVNKMGSLISAIERSPVEKVVFVSSTSVYGDEQGEVTEETMPVPTTESGKQLLESELLFKTSNEFKSTLLRFGGLIGPDRHPVTMLSGRENLQNGDAPVNLIHLNDCMLVIKAIIEQELWGETVNAVHPHHPSKQEYYREKALEKGLEPPKYLALTLKTAKTINSGRKFLNKLYPNFTSL